MIRCTTARVDLAAIQHNFRTIASFLASGESIGSSAPIRHPGIIAVVKANAYGHGAARVALALEEAGATMLACADIEEGIVLREAGVKGEILIFGALSVSDLAGIFDHRLTPTISTPSAARALQVAARARGTVLRYHLKIDSGMNRLGFRHDNLNRTMPEVLSSANLRLQAVYTHFATADDPENPLFPEQRARFDRACARLAELGAVIPVLHAANSAALLRDARAWYDLVRPGLLLFGVVPPPLASTLDLRPAMSLRSRVVAVKGVRTGESVGYGARFVAARPTRMAAVPAGYADGLDMRLAGRGFALVRGRRMPIIGAVSMDMMMLDVTDTPVETSDEVVLIGRQGDERIDAREMASLIGTIPYEILCRIGTRIERIY